MRSKDKRAIDKTINADIEPDETDARERVEEQLGDLADEHGWNWIPVNDNTDLPEPPRPDFILTQGRFNIFVKLDPSGNFEDGWFHTTLNNQRDLMAAIKDIV